jgi:hypothetical protein
VSVTLVLTQLLQHRGVEVGVIEKAKNYYVGLEHGKDGKWNLPLDERLSKERKKKCTREIMLLENIAVISVKIPFCACAKSQHLPMKFIHPINGRLPV